MASARPESSTAQPQNEYSEVRRGILARRLSGVLRGRVYALRESTEESRWRLAKARGGGEPGRITLEASEGACVARMRVATLGPYPSVWEPKPGPETKPKPKPVAELEPTPEPTVLDPVGGLQLGITDYGEHRKEECRISGRGPESGGGRRAKITGFSRASRRRMQETLAAVPYRAFDPSNLLFVTLTYPADYPSDPRRLQGDLKAWRKRIEREHGPMPGIWKMEPQKRGAPHFHLLLFAADDRLKSTIREAWHEIAGGGDRNHHAHGTDCRRVSGWREAMSYLSKYMAKNEQFAEGVEVGRIWGAWRRELWGVVWRAWNLTRVQYLKLRRVFRGRIGYRRGRGELQGMLCFIEYDALLRVLAWIGALGNSAPLARGPDEEPEPDDGALWESIEI